VGFDVLTTCEREVDTGIQNIPNARGEDLLDHCVMVVVLLFNQRAIYVITQSGILWKVLAPKTRF